jgi:hypothetical protein
MKLTHTIASYILRILAAIVDILVDLIISTLTEFKHHKGKGNVSSY